jgi:hypothetical protein
MRFAHLLCHLPLIATGLPLLAAAEPPSPPPLLDPAAATRPLVSAPMAAGKTVVNADTDWRAANAAVARFARGHADIVRWEKNQAGTPLPAQPPAQEHSLHRKEQP